MPSVVRSLKQEQRQLTAELRAQHKNWAEIATVFRQRYGVNMRAALRMARGWSQRDAADAWNQRWPAEAKTFKNFSYWETWPAPTGHAPSLEVLAKLAELYECRVADLLLDCGDFRALDGEYRDGVNLTVLPELISLDHQATDSAGDLAERLESLDISELARLAGRWAEQVSPGVDKRPLLLKLNAALSLAAALTSRPDTLPESASPTTPIEDLSGIWHSQYVYPSSGRGSDFVGDHYIVLRQHGTRLVAQSLPHTTGSQLRLDLALDSLVATGTWREQTSARGYYKGAVYHGSLQLLIEPSRQKMRGMWLGFGRDFNVNTGQWELTRESSSTSRSAQREYHLKA